MAIILDSEYEIIALNGLLFNTQTHAHLVVWILKKPFEFHAAL